MHLVLVAVLVTIVSARKEPVKKVYPDTRFIPHPERLPCDFSCSRRTAVQTIADGVFYTMECLDRNGNNLARCSTCCAMEALSQGLTPDRSSGLPTVDGKDCLCCFNKKC
uniref:Secreted protein n=1 Tax=Haemonchus contortus TaxID=6289 RepID=A0A7I4YIV0_HAECO